MLSIPAALLALPLVAGAAQTPDTEIHAQISEHYGKEVPDKAACIARPELPGKFSSDVAVAGVTQGTSGCKTLGVVVDGKWVDTNGAAPAALGAKHWGEAKADQRSEWLATWTQHGLLAFDTPASPTNLEVHIDKKGNHVVELDYFQRASVDDKRHLSRALHGSFTYNSDGVLQDVVNVEQGLYQTRFSLLEHKAGGIMPDRLLSLLKERSADIDACWEEAFARNHTLDGRILMQWTLRSGNVGGVTWVDEGRPIDQTLAACYRDVLQSKAFPEDMSGTVTWAFRTTRKELPPEAGVSKKKR